jgi:hypothetical protein
MSWLCAQSRGSGLRHSDPDYFVDFSFLRLVGFAHEETLTTPLSNDNFAAIPATGLGRMYFSTRPQPASGDSSPNLPLDLCGYPLAAVGLAQSLLRA